MENIKELQKEKVDIVTQVDFLIEVICTSTSRAVIDIITHEIIELNQDLKDIDLLLNGECTLALTLSQIEDMR